MRCDHWVPDGPDPDDTDVCDTPLDAHGNCPNAHRHTKEA